MKTDLSNLPASKQNHLSQIVAVIRDEFEQVTGFSHGKRKNSKILKIILFGSFATGKWVNDPAHGYISDYDILVILDRQELVEEYRIWDNVESRMAARIRPEVNIIVHSLKEVNEALVKGQYFFSDIKRDGIVLYESDRRELALAGNLSKSESKEIAEKDYEQWFESASEFVEFFQVAIERNYPKKAAFFLHQASEHFYACLLLVFTNYKPNTHNLVKLNSLAIELDEQTAEIFPQTSKVERRRFQLLKKAYIEARYSKHYKITEEELTWLGERVKQLQLLTEKLCKDKISEFDK
ncbi:hypothetical protein LO80_01895 [Candidatus Francisella endociliophora]|uniref:HEPN domain-containing protein n=1 Tax=Candidatus Francisella endociliophora TaxID=653937 RepID=A0A097EMQ6_9GAMM|nr:HEPN domain-containing protein [Francisella sp. FSC1006]AIT08851.1 hypothetical protein LO80_01895 [Francisella sp. FSC1006]